MIGKFLATVRVPSLAFTFPSQWKMRFAVAGSTLLLLNAGAQSYRGAGELLFSSFGPTNVYKESHRFEFRVEGRRWWIKTKPTWPAPYDYREAAFDGRTVYWLQSLESMVAERKAAGENVGVNIANAFTQKDGDILHDLDLDQMPAIWLSYCSGAFFKQQTNAMIEPAIAFGLQPSKYCQGPFKQKALWTLHERFPHTPIQVSYVADGWYRLPSPHEPVRRPAPFQDGFTNVVFKADQFKIIGSLALPQAATIETFRPGVMPDEREKLVLRFRYELKLLSAERTGKSEDDFVPKIPGVTTMIDDRFYSLAGSLSYFATNAWIDENTLTNSRRFATAVANKICYSHDTKKDKPPKE
ncbi:MAG: hypothetical protein L0Y58_04945 [Verrucomicrobia subdivision 3 bacterium]|nr:hypothetical protein [Limisphaerales bacterium]